jgi:hypothetical protein
LARAADQFRSSDVTVWGVAALCCWAFAILAANVSALIPGNVLAGLHASRLDGGTVNQLRMQVAEIDAESERLRRENALLLQRFDMQIQAQGDVTRRVGALEVSLPKIVERLPETASIDNSVTASIVDGTAMSFETEGGSVTVEQKPLIAVRPNTGGDGVETAAVVPDGSSYGVALGFPVAPEDGEAQWQEMMAKVGTLLIGLAPVLAEVDGSDGVMIVAGPIVTGAQAAELCERLERVGIPCAPAPFKGAPLPLLN